ncbi:MAG: TraR/DksA family transcriptional regulator [Acidimicrobiales bacterium]
MADSGAGPTPRLAALEAARREAALVVRDLERELEAIAESTLAGPDDEHDAEGSTVGYERARVLGLLASARTALARLDGAISRCRTGQEETCARCGAPIGAERLDALPGTERCARCARLVLGTRRLQ